ncbi:hypothetical protein CYMTET_33975, partial [Cymbomonas tetramitiformis]
ACGITESTGQLPAELAKSKGHVFTGEWLKKAFINHMKQKRRKTSTCAGRLSTMRVPRGMRDCALLLWVVVLGLLSMFLLWVVHPSPVHAGYGIWGCVVAALAVGGLAFLLRASTRDPGFVCSSHDTSSATPGGDVSHLDDPLLWGGHWHNLCQKCKKVRPLRSKYCHVSKRCVARFDHYCPWIGNAVGERNHPDFVIFLVMETLAMTISFAVTIYRLVNEYDDVAWAPVAHTHTSLIIFLISDGILLCLVFSLTFAHCQLVFTNMTTNESFNKARYKYLQNVDGGFSNPFDKGCWNNTLEFFSYGRRLPTRCKFGNQDVPDIEECHSTAA